MLLHWCGDCSIVFSIKLDFFYLCFFLLISVVIKKFPPEVELRAILHGMTNGSRLGDMDFAYEFVGLLN